MNGHNGCKYFIEMIIDKEIIEYGINIRRITRLEVLASTNKTFKTVVLKNGKKN